MTGKIERNSIQDNGMKKLKVSIKTFGWPMVQLWATDYAWNGRLFIGDQ